MENRFISLDLEKKLQTTQGVLNLKLSKEFNMNEFLVLFGPSGVGKTSILRMIAGLLRPDRGRISFGDEIWFDSEMNINMPAQERNIGYMFQDYALFPNMTVRTQIEFAQSKQDPESVEKILNDFDLKALEHRKPDKLSGGQKQRVALARALAYKPKMLLLDEPLSALDAEMRQSLQANLAKVRERTRCSIVMVSHDLAEVFRLATRVFKLHNGEVIGDGTPDEVFINQSISGKVQLVGQITRIEPQPPMFVLTVVTEQNQIIKVIAFPNDMEGLKLGDRVMVFTKAFNPIIVKI
ncbi:MAG: hypothetical protein RIS47_1640 [Bacteroidota bacterium]